jgi:hypothetical protein
MSILLPWQLGGTPAPPDTAVHGTAGHYGLPFRLVSPLEELEIEDWIARLDDDELAIAIALLA